LERRGDFKGSREPRSHADRAARADPNLADQSHVTDCDITHPPTCFNPVFLPHTLVTSRQILDGILHYWHQVCHYREYPIYTTTFTYAHIHPHWHTKRLSHIASDRDTHPPTASIQRASPKTECPHPHIPHTTTPSSGSTRASTRYPFDETGWGKHGESRRHRLLMAEMDMMPPCRELI